MKRGLRIALGVTLALVGLLAALFFTAILFIADCSENCQANGERAPAFGFIGLGAGALVCGTLLLSDREKLAWGSGFLVAGIIALVGGIVARGMLGWITAGAGLIVAGLAAWSLRAKR